MEIHFHALNREVDAPGEERRSLAPQPLYRLYVEAPPRAAPRRAWSRPNLLKLLGAAALGLAIGLVAAGAARAANPTLEEAVAFARSELSRLCGDARISDIDAIDRVTVGGGRRCQVLLAPGRLRMSIRQRSAASNQGRAYARMQLDVRFDRESGFLCGPTSADGRATLFFACRAGFTSNGPVCAERKVSIARPGRTDYTAAQNLAAASILRTGGETCETVAKALSYIGERSRPPKETSVKDYFSR